MLAFPLCPECGVPTKRKVQRVAILLRVESLGLDEQDGIVPYAATRRVLYEAPIDFRCLQCQRHTQVSAAAQAKLTKQFDEALEGDSYEHRSEA